MSGGSGDDAGGNGAARPGRVLLISNGGTKLGEMSEAEAIERAQGLGLALKIVGQVREGLSVMRMIDLDLEARRLRRKEAQRTKRRLENRRRSAVKSIRVSPTTGEHDFGIKMRHARRFLEEGKNVKVFVFFRRGQGKLQLEAKDCLKRAVDNLSEWGTVVEQKNGEEVGVRDPGEKRPLEVLFRPTLGRKEREAKALKQALE